MLNFEQSPLWLDVRDIINSGKKDVRYEYKAMLHTEKEDISILKIISIDTIRDYVNKIGDQIHLQFKLPLGEYVYRLYPYRNNLEISIKKILLEEIAATREANSTILVERYKAVFSPTENPPVAGTELETQDAESLNKQSIVDIQVQLLDRSLEPLRIKTVSGSFKQVTAKQVIHNLVAGESTKILVDGKPAIDGIDIIEPDNKEVKTHFIIPQGTRITSIPTLIQENQGGLYSGGTGTYLQKYKDKKLWFIYPLFNTNRFNDPVDKLIIYAAPQERLPGHDRTFKKEAGVIKIVATAAKKYQDSADTDYMNHGVGFRMADARSFMKKPIEIGPNGPVGKRTQLNHEVALSDRKDGLNYAPMSGDKISSNPFKEYAKFLARNVARVDFSWENGDASLLYPGMPCKYIFLNKNKPIELEGVLVFVHDLTSLQGNSITEGIYKSVISLTILTEKHTTAPELPTIKAYGDF